MICLPSVDKYCITELPFPFPQLRLGTVETKHQEGIFLGICLAAGTRIVFGIYPSNNRYCQLFLYIEIAIRSPSVVPPIYSVRVVIFAFTSI